MPRMKNDEYNTPAALTQALIFHLGLDVWRHAHICEPCVGNRAIADVFNTYNRSFDLGIGFVTNDVNPLKPAMYHVDAKKEDEVVWHDRWYDWTVTNPPFKHAYDIVYNALKHSRGVAMLLRLSFLEPTVQRGQLLRNWADNMSDVIIFGQPRPSFVKTAKSSTDSVTTAWFVWRSGWYGGPRIHFDTGWKTRYERSGGT